MKNSKVIQCLLMLIYLIHMRPRSLRFMLVEGTSDFVYTELEIMHYFCNSLCNIYYFYAEKVI